MRAVFAGCLQHLWTDQALNLVTKNIVTCTFSKAILNLGDLAVDIEIHHACPSVVRYFKSFHISNYIIIYLKIGRTPVYTHQSKTPAPAHK